ncbi:MAG: hypothetical protein KDA80_17550 [Planctomycetaceae bacterium]|nr:hypothetical protein [Planctomycetaceae bacterium]
MASVANPSIEEVDSELARRDEQQQLHYVLESVREALLTNQERRQQLLDEMQEVAIELAVAIASELVCTAIDRDAFDIDGLLKRGLGEIDSIDRVTIQLNPQDLDLLKRRCEERHSSWTNSVFLKANSTLARGDCRIEQEDGHSLVRHVAAHLSTIRRHLLEELDHAQIERRQTQESDRLVKRFPDRRETA